jgi:hypothetical protein
VGHGVLEVVTEENWDAATLEHVDDSSASPIEITLDEPFHIGRAHSAHLQLQDNSVSSHHAVLHRRGSRLLLSDLSSTNGTRVNTSRISGTVVLNGGDTVSFGSGPGFRLNLWERESSSVPVSDAARTLSITKELFPFVLTASLDRGPGPTAEFRSPLGLQHRVRSENRCVLLYVLAKRMQEDLAQQTQESLAGWVDDEQLRREIWGHTAKTMYPNNLQVLIRRLRKELEENGFDGWCIQKHHGHTRVAVDVTLAQE